jgi:hypothetical protein
MIGKEDKGNWYILSALKNIYRPSIRIDRKPLYDKKGRSSVEALLRLNPQGEKDIVPFPNNKFLKHS